MPITVDSEIVVLSDEEFHTLAYQVMGIVFGVHNEFGRLVDEEIYKQAIRRRCEDAGIVPARREVEIKVRYRDFEKSYFMDLLFALGLMVEAKTVESLNNAHHAQTLQYLMLTGMRHGLLINLRREKVEKRFVSTTLSLAERQRLVVHESDWQPVNEGSHRLHQICLELLADWGAFLSTSLYREALVHCFGGPSVALQRTPVYDGDAVLGTHEVCLIADNTALALTAVKDGKSQMKDHLERFLSHTKLAYVQWINLDNHDIEFRTLKNVAG
jgi:GxxExxY protein